MEIQQILRVPGIISVTRSRTTCGAARRPPAHKQTIWANTPNDWGVESNMAAGNTAVLVYPDIGQIFGDKRKVSSYHLIRNGFTESMPRHLAGLRAEAADDVWLNTGTSK
jgi:hypothetical protein